MSSDLQLRQNVLDELDFEPAVDAVHIGVAVHAGIVTLSGFVESYAEKLAAERAVRRVKGVKAIAEEIEVRLPSDKKTADDEIAQRAVSILRWWVGVPAERISVTVEKGIVTLTGNVEAAFERADAEAAIHRLSGVVGIINLIRVGAPVDAGAIRQKIQKALHRNAQLDASRITIETSGSRVVLRGKVNAWHERDLAEQAAWAAPGVSEVEDHIQVEP
jgi:osmotically-inducible protein OsmY